MHNRTARKIAIVGGGISGISTLIELVKSARETRGFPAISITLFNKSPEIGPGLPYSAHSPDRFLLNHEMNDMGGIDVHKEVNESDFYDWVQEHKTTLAKDYPHFDLNDPEEHVPRNLYGKYLTYRYEEAKAFARREGIEVREIVGDVTDVKLQRTLANVHYSAHDQPHTESFDKVVLALGHSYASREEFSATGQYFKANETNSLLQENLAGKTLTIQGTGQYSDEIALAALDAGAKHVAMISRHGLLHAVRGPYTPYQRKHLTIENLEALSGGPDKPFHLKDVVILLQKELEEATGAAVNWRDMIAPGDAAEVMRKRIAFAETGQELKWRSVIRSLESIRQEIYARLTPDDREAFNFHHRALFFTYNAPIPLKIARKMLAYLESGKLEILSGWQTSEWVEADQKFKVTHARKGMENHDPFSPIADKDLAETKSDYLVGAHGQTLCPQALPLLKNMIQAGDVMTHHCGGIAINPQSQHIRTQRGDVAQLYALGPITNGEMLISSQASYCIKSAKTIAHSIIQELSTHRTAEKTRQVS